MKMPQLNRPVVLQAPVQSADGAGGYIKEWQVLGTLWAEIAPRTGRETAAFATSVSRVSYVITVRAAPSGAQSRPVAGQRFVDGSRVLNILAVTERDASGRFLKCFAEEEVAS